MMGETDFSQSTAPSGSHFHRHPWRFRRGCASGADRCLTSGLLTETAKRIEGIGADIMLQPPGASYILGFSNAPMR